MEKTVEEKLMNALKEKSEDLIQDENFKKLESANETFNNMIEKGLTVKRGYNLLSLNDDNLYMCEIYSK